MMQYDADYYQWTQDTARRLRSGEFNKIEFAAPPDEVEDLGKRERSALENRLIVLICHLLEWDYQPQKWTRSWQATACPYTIAEILCDKDVSLPD